MMEEEHFFKSLLFLFTQNGLSFYEFNPLEEIKLTNLGSHYHPNTPRKVCFQPNRPQVLI